MSELGIRPVADHVLIRRKPDPRESASGLIVFPDIADRASENRRIASRLLADRKEGKEAPLPPSPYFEGEVLAVGPGRTTKKNVLIPPPCKPGDRVLFKPPMGGFEHDTRTPPCEVAPGVLSVEAANVHAILG